MSNNITGTAFSFEQMLEKLQREILRLKSAESKADEENATDHALNGAFTGYHLIEWEAKDQDPTESRKVRTILEEEHKIPELKLLHDITTTSKHVSV